MGNIEKHTPGPWKMRRSGRISVAGFDICAIAALPVPGGFSLNGEAFANAALIAAAPDLLEALRALRERHQIDDPHHAHLCDFCKQADAAIAKAEGRTS